MIITGRRYFYEYSCCLQLSRKRFYLNDNEDDDEEFVFALIIAGALETFAGILRFLFEIDVKDNKQKKQDNDPVSFNK